MKQLIADLIAQSLRQLQEQQKLELSQTPPINIDGTKDKAHGDYASNIAMLLAKEARMPPRQVAQLILDHLPASKDVSKVEIAGPGFINFFINEASQLEIISTIISAGENFGRSNIGQNESYQVEFVSANPTGPLHVGHGRGAAYGACIANLMEAAGYAVHREYYVNDAGRQMNILATSVWLRYLELCGETFHFPSNGYKGQYILEIAKTLQERHGEAFRFTATEVFKDIPADEPQGGDKEEHIDALVERARQLLGAERYLEVFDLGLNAILDDIKDDLAQFGVLYQTWFSERSLKEDIDKAVAKLEAGGHLYEKDGALWFRSTSFGDDKDRVIRRDNGETTYFASDIAYHFNKFERGFSKVINVWGADHHGYIARVKAALQALDIDPERLMVKLVQFAILYRGSERVQMSTRSGSFVTLRELREEVGDDAARFFYVTRKPEQHMDFDLDLAKSQSKDNPVYYIQYAHARICSVLKKLEDQGQQWHQSDALANLHLLTEEAEKDLVTALSRYPETLAAAAQYLEPHQLTNYLRDLASDFHAYYNSHKVLAEDQQLRDARIALSLAVKQVIYNGLALLGVSAPQAM